MRYRRQDGFRKHVSPPEAAARIRRYCAYQERSHQEVRDKLFEYGLTPDQVNELLSLMISDGFLNEERFAKAFAGGKFRMMKWGKLKIERELEQRRLTPRCIAAGLKEIDDSDYKKVLRELIAKKLKQTTDKNPFVRRNKVARAIMSKGFEPELVWEELKVLLPDEG